jgi:hypothetical protein
MIANTGGGGRLGVLAALRAGRRPDPYLTWSIAPAVLTGELAIVLTVIAGITGVTSPVTVVMLWTVHFFFFPEGPLSALLQSSYANASGVSAYGALAWVAFVIFAVLGAALVTIRPPLRRIFSSATGVLGPLDDFNPQQKSDQ